MSYVHTFDTSAAAGAAGWGMMTEQTTSRDSACFAQSFAYRERAIEHLAYGVSSTPRAHQLPVAVAIARGEGAHLIDIDGNRFIDYQLGYGPLILGHTPDAVMAAIRDALDAGLRTASVHPGEAALAERIAGCMPGCQQTSFVSTGTEAAQLALRVARAETGRTRVIKFRANYHGWSDSINIGNAIGKDGPGTLGQDPGAVSAVTLLDWGDAAAVADIIDSSFAAVIVEPAAINGGCFEPPPGFLQALRNLTERHGVMLIFDEVITGFRIGLGGAQQRYGVTPDLTVLGKALGAGLPIGAVSGSREAMAVLSTGRLTHRGTFNGNPLSIAAANACLAHLQHEAGSIYHRMEAQAGRLTRCINDRALSVGVPVQARHVGAAMQIVVAGQPVTALSDSAFVDREATLRFTAALLREGIFTLPRGLCYLSTVHTDDDIERTEAGIATAMGRYEG